MQTVECEAPFQAFQIAVFKKSPQMTTFFNLCGHARVSWILCNILLCLEIERETQQQSANRGGTATQYGKRILDST